MKFRASVFYYCGLLVLLVAPIVYAEPSVERGAKLFKKCAACHFLEQDRNKIGPSLHKLLGRKAGSVENYNYSPAMKSAGAAGLRWTKENLQNYLHDPHNMVKGTKMAAIKIDNEQDFADLLSYLQAVDK